MNKVWTSLLLFAGGVFATTALVCFSRHQWGWFWFSVTTAVISNVIGGRRLFAEESAVSK
jgi:hypothetical protein